MSSPSTATAAGSSSKATTTTATPHHGGLSDLANDETLFINTTSHYTALAKRLYENVPKPDLVNLTTQGCGSLAEIQLVLDALVHNTTVSRLTVYGDFFKTDKIIRPTTPGAGGGAGGGSTTAATSTSSRRKRHSDRHHRQLQTTTTTTTSQPPLVESLIHLLQVNKTIRTIRFVERGRKLRRVSKGSALETFLGVLERAIGPESPSTSSLRALSIDDPFTISMEAATKLETLFSQPFCSSRIRAELFLTIRSVPVFHKVVGAIEQMQLGVTLSIQNLISNDAPIQKLCQVMDHISSLDIAVAQTNMLTQLGQAIVAASTVSSKKHKITLENNDDDDTLSSSSERHQRATSPCQALPSLSSSSSSLQSLVINVTPLTGYHSDSIVSFFQQLQHATTLRHLGFFWYRQTIPRDAMTAMVEALKGNPALDSFAFKHHLWRDDPTEDLLGALRPALSFLKKFSLGVSVVGSRGESSDAEAWTTALQNNDCLECLEVTSLLSTAEVLAIVKAFPTMTRLKQVTMTPKEKRFGAADARSVVEAIQASPSLTDLHSSTMFLPKRMHSEAYHHCMRRKIGADKILLASQEEDEKTVSSSSSNNNETPLSLWPLMLAQLDKGKWISLQYDFIRQKADVLIPKKSSNRETRTTGAGTNASSVSS